MKSHRIGGRASRRGCYGSFAAAFTGLLNALFTELFDAVLTELLDALFTELFDAVLTEPLDALFTELFDAVLTEPLDALFTELFDAVLTELLDALFTELLDAVFTELLDAPFTEFLDASTELFVDDLAATALPRDPPLLTCFDLEEAFAAATFGLLGVGDLAVFGLARIRGAVVSTLAGLSTAVISGLCTAASDSPLLVDLDSDSPRAPSTPPPVVVTRAFAAFSGRINPGSIRRSKSSPCKHLPPRPRACRRYRNLP